MMDKQQQTVKRKRTSLDINQKAEIIQAAEKGEKQVEIAMRYGDEDEGYGRPVVCKNCASASNVTSS
jgi:hypothetical protein